MKDEKSCEERLVTCTKRMDSQAKDIDKLFSTKASKYLLGFFFILLLGSFGYTKTVADDVSEIVTKQDMIQYQKEIIDAIKEIKQ